MAPRDTEDWVRAYNEVMAPGGPAQAPKGGPGCCSVCCTLYSIFAALFLFVLASAMKSRYPYMHVHGACMRGGRARGLGAPRSAAGSWPDRAGWGGSCPRCVRPVIAEALQRSTRRLAAFQQLDSRSRPAAPPRLLPAPHPPSRPAGDMNMMSKAVTYAGLAYLAFALLSMFFWVKGVVSLRPAATTTQSSSYSAVQ